jgi:hypothetical protein
LLSDYETQARTRQILWPKNRKMTPKLRAFNTPPICSKELAVQR